MTRPLLLALALVLAACSAPATASSDRPALSPSDVTVYTTEAEVGGEFEVIQYIDLSSRSGYRSPSDPVEAARAAAARLGANGLLVLEENAEIADARIQAAIHQRGGYDRVTYIAIHVPGPEPTP